MQNSILLLIYLVLTSRLYIHWELWAAVNHFGTTLGIASLLRLGRRTVRDLLLMHSSAKPILDALRAHVDRGKSFAVNSACGQGPERCRGLLQDTPEEALNDKSLEIVVPLARIEFPFETQTSNRVWHH